MIHVKSLSDGLGGEGGHHACTHDPYPHTKCEYGSGPAKNGPGNMTPMCDAHVAIVLFKYRGSFTVRISLRRLRASVQRSCSVAGVWGYVCAHGHVVMNNCQACCHIPRHHVRPKHEPIPSRLQHPRGLGEVGENHVD